MKLLIKRIIEETKKALSAKSAGLPPELMLLFRRMVEKAEKVLSSVDENDLYEGLPVIIGYFMKTRCGSPDEAGEWLSAFVGLAVLFARLSEDQNQDDGNLSGRSDLRCIN
ncbi:MAG: hypothetical protein QXP81_09370 [Nitrososphaerota archaeon]